MAHTALTQKDTDSSNYSLGVSLNNSLNNFSYLGYGGNSPLITIQNHQHQFEIGPRFENAFSEYQRLGVEFNYRYYPNSNLKRFGMFLFTNICYMRWTDENYSVLIPENEPYFGTSKRNYVTITIGYGVQVNIYKGLYFGSNVGAGCGLRFGKREYDYENPSLPNLIVNYNDSDPAVLISFNLGYRF